MRVREERGGRGIGNDAWHRDTAKAIPSEELATQITTFQCTTLLFLSSRRSLAASMPHPLNLRKHHRHALVLKRLVSCQQTEQDGTCSPDVNFLIVRLLKREKEDKVTITEKTLKQTHEFLATFQRRSTRKGRGLNAFYKQAAYLFHDFRRHVAR